MADGLKPKDVAAAIKANVNKPDELKKLLALTRAVVPAWQAQAKQGKLPADGKQVLKLIESRLGQIMATQRKQIAAAKQKAQAGRQIGGGGISQIPNVGGSYLRTPGTYLARPGVGGTYLGVPGTYVTAKPASPKASAQINAKAAQAAKTRAAVAGRAKVAAHVAKVKSHQLKLAEAAKKVQQSVRLKPTAEQAAKARTAMGKLRTHMAADAKNIIEIQKLLKSKKKK